MLSLGLTDTNLYAGCDDGYVYYNNAGTWTSTLGPEYSAESAGL